MPASSAGNSAPVTHGSSYATASATAQGLTSSRPSRAVELVGLAALAVIALLGGALLARPAEALTVVSPDAQWQPWALKWQRIALRERREVVRLTRVLALRPPRAVPGPTEFTVWPDDPEGAGLQSWRLFGRTCKDLALWWRDVRIPDLRRRLADRSISCTCPAP